MLRAIKGGVTSTPWNTSISKSDLLISNFDRHRRFATHFVLLWTLWTFHCLPRRSLWPSLTCIGWAPDCLSQFKFGFQPKWWVTRFEIMSMACNHPLWQGSRALPSLAELRGISGLADVEPDCRGIARGSLCETPNYEELSTPMATLWLCNDVRLAWPQKPWTCAQFVCAMLYTRECGRSPTASSHRL